MIVYSFSCRGCGRRVEVPVERLADVPLVGALRYGDCCHWMTGDRPDRPDDPTPASRLSGRALRRASRSV
jgi:hypothetical protein